MARNLIKVITIDGQDFTASQPTFGDVLDMWKAEKKAGEDLVAVSEVKLRAVARAIGVGEGEVAKLSWHGVSAAYVEILEFALEDVPKDDAQGKPASP